jgi:hypothetical protein
MADVSLSLDLSAQELYSELQNAGNKVSQFASNTEKSVSGIKFGSLGTNLIQGLAGLGLGAEIKSVVDYGARIQDLSDRFGIGVVSLQKFGNAAEKNGSSLEAVARGYRFLEVNQAKALGGNEGMVKAFADLGISVQDLQNLRPDDLMLRLGDSSLNAADVVKVLGKSALELRPTLAGLSDGTIQFGDAIDSISIAKLKEADDVFKTLHQNVTILVGSSLGLFFDGLTSAIGRTVTAGFALVELMKGIINARSSLLSGNLYDAKEALAAGSLNATNYFASYEKQTQDETTAKFKRDLGATPEETETGEFDEQGRPIGGGAGGGGRKKESKIDHLTEENAKDEEQQRLDALSTEERIAELRQKAKGLLADQAAVAPRAGHEADEGEEELKLQIRHEYLEVTKELANEEKKLAGEKDKEDKAAKQNEAALASAKETTQQMELRAKGDEEGAKQAGIRAKYEKEIAAALDRKNPNQPLADELKKQEKFALDESRLREAGKSPAERQKEAQNEREAQRKRSLAEALLKDEDDRANRRLHGAGGLTSGGLSTGKLQSGSLSDALSDDDFHNQFKRGGGINDRLSNADAWHKQFQAGGNRAEQVRDAMKEKSGDDKKTGLKAALDESTVLKEIAKNTSEGGVNK